MLIEELKKLQTEGQPQTLDELFNQSKEGMMSDRVIGNVNEKLPQMKERMMNEMKMIISEEVKNQVGMIKIKDGRNGLDAKSPDLQKIAEIVLGKIPKPENGKDGKDAPGIEEIISKIPRPVSRGGGGSTLRVDNLSSQANGSTKTFTTTYRIGSAHLIYYSSFPSVFIPTTDYSVSGNIITLGVNVLSPIAGQNLVIIYESSD